MFEKILYYNKVFDANKIFELILGFIIGVFKYIILFSIKI